MCSDVKDIGPILKEIFPSPEMAAYLTKRSLERRQIRDAVAYAASGLAGIQYGIVGIPEEWLSVIAKRVDIESLCRDFAKKL